MQTAKSTSAFDGEAALTGTLQAMGEAGHFNQWLFDTIAPYLKGNMIEIGSGIGNMTELLLQTGQYLVATDISKDYLGILNNRFKAAPNFAGLHEMDLSLQDFDSRYSQHLNKYDTVVALNVIEHIKDDASVIANCNKLLKKNGHLIIVVPAYQVLYNGIDKALGHFCRYTVKFVISLFKNSSIGVIKAGHFNLLGVPAWFVAGQLLRDKEVTASKMGAFNKIVPLARVIDKLVLNKIGLSVVGIGLKQ